jgi:predicted TPR repeat methyltransferase
MSASRSSGDPIADRRFDYAMRYREGGDAAAAADLMAQALELAPHWAAGWLTLGETLEMTGDHGGAAEAYRRALTLDPADSVGAGARLARLGLRPADGAVTPGHVAALFDDYAPRFEKALVERLHYRAPALMRALLDSEPPRRFRHAIDIGCGTGLGAAAFADLCERIDGVDLSPNMLAIARETGLYAELTAGEALAFVRSLPAGSIDLAIAADVLVYMGDLAGLFDAVSRALAPGGSFIFTVQDGGEDAFRIGPDLRYAHGAAALRRWAGAAGLSVRRLDPSSTRNDADKPVPGLVALAVKPAQTEGSNVIGP